MTAVAFDTLEAAKVLRGAGFGEAQAEALVATIGTAVREHAATKTDLAEAKTDIAEVKADLAEVKTRLAGLETRIERLEARIEGLEARLTEVRAAIAEFRAEMYRHLWLMGFGIIGVTVALIKLLPG